MGQNFTEHHVDPSDTLDNNDVILAGITIDPGYIYLTGQTIRVRQIINHPDYNTLIGAKDDNDIAILKLDSPMTFNQGNIDIFAQFTLFSILAILVHFYHIGLPRTLCKNLMIGAGESLEQSWPLLNTMFENHANT